VVKWKKLIKMPFVAIAWIIGWVIAYYGRKKKERKNE
jgi:hypothetical protein